MTRTPAQMFGTIFGAVYLLIGVLGFLIANDADFTGPNGDLLFGFEVNGLHNIVHLAIGAVLLIGARAADTARSFNTMVGVVYLIVGVIGFFIGKDSDANILAINLADNLLHLATAALALTIGRQTAARTTTNA